MIKLEKVFLAYNREYYALFDVSLNFKNGERVALIGENGSGKTAILRLIAGLEKFQKGQVLIKDIPLEKVDFSHDVSLGYISSKAVFFESKSVEKNLQWILKTRGEPKENWDKMIEKVLLDYEITHLKKARISTLCRSDKRLVQIARLALRPLDILLCDELEMGGDHITKERLNKALTKLINSEPKDKIVIMAYDKEEDCDSFITRRIHINLGSIEEKNSEEE